MTAYEEQVETGKSTLLSELARVARESNEPRLLRLAFQMTDRDFDLDVVSLVDRERLKVVVKVERDDLADSAADEGIRRKIIRELEQAVRNYTAVTERRGESVRQSPPLLGALRSGQHR